MYEVEMKFRVTETVSLENFLAVRGATWSDEVEENDIFFQHPQHDFRQTDEGLRIRTTRFADGALAYTLTYKGPKIDAVTKTRREINVQLIDDSISEVLQALGFSPVGTVRKRRRAAEWNENGRAWTLTHDTLLPQQKTFCEIETLAEAADLESARHAIIELAAALGLSDSVRTSYLAMTLQEEFPSQNHDDANAPHKSH